MIITNKKHKKILFVTESLTCGGMETVLVTISNILANMDYDVTIICYDPRSELVSELNKKIHYIYKPRKEFPVMQKFPHIRRYFNYRKAVWEHRVSSKRLYKYYVGNKKYDVEIGFFRGPSIKIVSGSTNKKSKKLAWVHTDFKLCNPKSITSWFNNMEEVKTAYGKMNNIVCVSDKARESFNEVIGLKEKSTTVYNLIPSNKIIEKSFEEIPLKKNKFTLITVGRLIPDKRHDRLLSATKKLNEQGYNFDVWIVGYGPCENELKKYCEDNKIENVFFTGIQSNPYSYMRNADLFVLTSYREGFPLVIPEAMACGLPVLSTSCTGPTEALKNGKYGILVDNSSEGVYNGIKNILDNKEILRDYRKKSQERYMDFDEETIIKEIIALFEQ